MTPTNQENPFAPVEDVLREIREGKMVVVVDDADRENEGDLILAAEKITPQAVNFMAKFGRGLICCPTTQQRLRQLGIEEMVSQNRDSFRTDFQISVDAAQGITTGISAADRAETIRVLANPTAIPEDLAQPGHVFPLRAKDGGVLQRAGHTEAAVDLARLAGCRPIAVICEIMNDDGSMARLPELQTFAAKHGLKLCSIEKLIEHRRQRERLVEKIETVNMPTDYGAFQLHLYRSSVDGANHIALTCGNLADGEAALVRVHSECLTGDIFGSQRCDCGEQLHQAMKRITDFGKGVLLYMRQEGRGIGLAAKIHAYKLQEQGYDTIEANLRLGYDSDLREYGIGAQILVDLGIRKIRLLTNNPKKVIGLDGYGLEIVEQLPITTQTNPHNEKYLETKKLKMGHLI